MTKRAAFSSPGVGGVKMCRLVITTLVDTHGLYYQIPSKIKSSGVLREATSHQASTAFADLTLLLDHHPVAWASH